MISFIIYENQKIWQEKYKTIIYQIMGNKKEKYHILTIDKYNKSTLEKINNLLGKKIFLLNMEVPEKSGLDLAKIIRDSGDWISQMILITSQENEKEKKFTSNILMLDFITKNNELEKNIKKSISVALNIHSHLESFNFTNNNEIYQIPYNNILYFEKDLNNNYTSIITMNNPDKPYKIKLSITKIETELQENPNFMKIHQSCIVNLKNIEHVDFNTNTIYFKNGKVGLISRNKKKELKEKLTKGYPYE